MLFCDSDTIIGLNSTDIDKLIYSKIPESEVWRVGLVEELVMARQGIIDIPGFAPNEITDILDDICVN